MPPEGYPEIHKLSIILPISDEMIYGDPRPGHTEPPSAEDVAAYKAWKAKFKPLYKEGRKRGWFSDGGPDYGSEYTPPKGRWVFDD